MFSFYSCGLWQKFRGTQRKNTIFSFAPTQPGSLILLRTASAQNKISNSAQYRKVCPLRFAFRGLFFQTRICLKLCFGCTFPTDSGQWQLMVSSYHEKSKVKFYFAGKPEAMCPILEAVAASGEPMSKDVNPVPVSHSWRSITLPTYTNDAD